MQNFSSRLWYNHRRINANGEASLYIQVIIASKHKEFPLKLKWPADKIDTLQGVLQPRHKTDPDVADYNMIILTERAKHNEISKVYRLKGAHFTMDALNSELKTFSTKESYVAFALAENKRRYNRREIERKTFQNHNASIAQVIEYKCNVLIGEIDEKWVKHFKNWLQQKSYKPGTIWVRIKDLQAMLRLAESEPMIHVNPSAFKFRFPKPKNETVFLNREELRRLLLYYDPLYLTKIQYNVLSAFLFCCFTGIRISDVYKINHTWEISGDFIRFLPHKNRKSNRYITIPVIPVAKTFIQNLKGAYFNLPTEQEYNRTLKDLAQMDGIEITKNLTSHVARHTHGYLYMTSVGNLYGLKESLGHAKIETTDRYAHLDQEYALKSAKKLQEAFADMRMLKIVG